MTRMGLALSVCLVLVSLGGFSPAQAAQSNPVTYQDQTYAGLVTTPPTADKPQSKLFFGQGSWWAIMLDSDGKFRIHELMPDHSWRIAGNVVDDRVASTADLLYDGTKLYVASRDPSSPLEVTRMSFEPVTRSWTVDLGFPKAVNSGGSESAAIEKDSTGRLWVTYTRSLKVWVTHTTTDDQTWTTPTQPQVGDTTISADDLSGLISFQGKIGLMYSDEENEKFSFAVHKDGDPDSTWSYESITNGALFADDHLNLKNVSDDPSGRVYAVVKTSKNDPTGAPPTDPLIELLVRESDGTWHQHVVATVADEWTRPQVQIDTVNKRVLVFGTAPIKGGTIYEKSASINDLSFPSGRGTPYVTFNGAYINNASGTKQPLTQQSGVVIMATSGSPDIPLLPHRAVADAGRRRPAADRPRQAGGEQRDLVEGRPHVGGVERRQGRRVLHGDARRHPDRHVDDPVLHRLGGHALDDLRVHRGGQGHRRASPRRRACPRP